MIFGIILRSSALCVDVVIVIRLLIIYSACKDSTNICKRQRILYKNLHE